MRSSRNEQRRITYTVHMGQVHRVHQHNPYHEPSATMTKNIVFLATCLFAWIDSKKGFWDHDSVQVFMDSSPQNSWLSLLRCCFLLQLCGDLSIYVLSKGEVPLGTSGILLNNCSTIVLVLYRLLYLFEWFKVYRAENGFVQIRSPQPSPGFRVWSIAV